MLTQWLRNLGNQVTLPKLARDSAWPCFPASFKSKGDRGIGYQRQKDPYSRILDRHSADIQVDTNHYSYEYREDVKGIIYDWIRQSDKNRCD